MTSSPKGDTPKDAKDVTIIHWTQRALDAESELAEVKAALREALDGWLEAEGSCEGTKQSYDAAKRRIAELRRLCDKT